MATKIRLATQSDLDLDGNDLVGLPTVPGAADAAASKAYVDAVATGLVVKTSCRAATTGAITLQDEQTIDDVAVVAGNRVLVKNQADTTKDGIYIVVAGANPWTRATGTTGMPAGSDQYGNYCFVNEGTANKGKGFVQTTDGIVGTDLQDWAEFYQIPAATAYTASDGVTLNVLNFELDKEAALYFPKQFRERFLGTALVAGVLTLAHTFDGSMIDNKHPMVWVNGMLQREAVDYTIVALAGEDEITFVGDLPDAATDYIEVLYYTDEV